MSVELISHFAETATVRRYGSSQQEVVIVYDDDFVSGNVITLKVNWDDISVPFNADHDQTMQDLADALAALSSIDTAVVSASREITLTSAVDGNQIIVTDFVVTGGATQPEGSVDSVTGGYGEDGMYSAGSVTEFNIAISMQPLLGEELQKFPEAERNRRHMKGYTATRLYTSDSAESTKADRIVYDSTVFEVQAVERWRGDLNHYKVMCAEVDNPSDDPYDIEVVA